GILRACFLRVGGRAAAMKIGAITGNRFWLLTMGYSDEFEECSPGTLLLIETIRHAARSGLLSYEFLGGDEPWIRVWTQVLRPCRSLSGIGFRSTVGYVIAPDDGPRAVADRYLATIDAIGAERFDCYVSVKAPELRFSRDLFHEIAQRARERGVGLHFDALGPEDVDETFSLIDELRTIQPKIGCTLPGRWRRSVADADGAIDLHLSVRVVKGEWADRAEHEVDPRSGSLAVVERLAGRVRHAAIGTHDANLARGALR